MNSRSLVNGFGHLVRCAEPCALHCRSLRDYIPLANGARLTSSFPQHNRAVTFAHKFSSTKTDVLNHEIQGQFGYLDGPTDAAAESIRVGRKLLSNQHETPNVILTTPDRLTLVDDYTAHLPEPKTAEERPLHLDHNSGVGYDAMQQEQKETAWRRVHKHTDARQPQQDTVCGSSITEAELSVVYNVLRRRAATGNVAVVEQIVQDLIRQHGENPNLKLYSSLILANVSRTEGSAAMVRHLLEEMATEGIMPDASLYHDALKALAVHPDCILRGEILAEMSRRWFSLTDSGWHDVAAGYLREGLLEQAMETLSEMRNARVIIQSWLFDLAVHVLCEFGEVEEALDVMQDRIRAGDLKSSLGAWYCLFDTACSELHYDALRFVWQRRVTQDYLNPTSGQCLQVLNAAARRGDVQIATDVFRILTKRAFPFESHHYELLIEAYIEASDLRTALTIFCIMNTVGLAPSQSATSAISLYLKESPDRPMEAFRILEELKEDRAVPTEAVNRIIEACIQQEGLSKGIEIYKSLHRICPSGANVNTFNALFAGCNYEKQKETAMFLAAEMLALKIQPNALTYERLALTCMEASDMDAALRYYAEMRGAGLIPRAGTLSILIQKTCDKGDPRAWELLKSMKEFGFDDRAVRQYVMERRTHDDVPTNDSE